MELRQLRYFIAVCANGSVAGASRVLHIAQPALSRQMLALEEELGAKLLVRLPRGIALTRAGEALLAHAKTVVDGTDNLKSQVTLASAGKVGSLRIGITPGYSWLPILGRVIEKLSLESPNTEICLEPALSLQQFDLIKRHELDAGIACWRSALDGSYEGIKIFEDPMALAIPMSLARSMSEVPSLDELRGQNFILFPRAGSPSHFDVVARALKSAGISVVRGGVTASDIPTIVGLVSAGLGCAIVPLSYRSQCPANIVIREIKGLNLSFNMELVWGSDTSDPLLKSFIAILTKELAHMHPASE